MFIIKSKRLESVLPFLQIAGFLPVHKKGWILFFKMNAQFKDAQIHFYFQNCIFQICIISFCQKTAYFKKNIHSIQKSPAYAFVRQSQRKPCHAHRKRPKQIGSYCYIASQKEICSSNQYMQASNIPHFIIFQHFYFFRTVKYTTF